MSSYPQWWFMSFELLREGHDFLILNIHLNPWVVIYSVCFSYHSFHVCEPAEPLHVGCWVLLPWSVALDCLLALGRISFLMLTCHIIYPWPGINHFSKKPCVFFSGEWYLETIIWALGYLLLLGSLCL